MNNIKTAQAIADKVAKGDMRLGRVSAKTDGEYVLLNYTAEAQYGGDMTEIEKTCRGLVVRTDGKITALPMPKFFNLGEPQCPALPDEPYHIWEKIDGSLGIFWHDGKDWRCNTRGSFDNEYIDFAQWRWDDTVDAQALRPNWTVMVEICMDDDINPRAAYSPEGLYLIAMRDLYSGKDFTLLEPNWYINGFRHPKLIEADIDQLLERQAEKEGMEGWVVRYDSGFRVKVKTAWYLRMFRAMTSMSPKRIRELMIEAGQNWLDEFPDDLRPEAMAIQEDIENRFREELRYIHDSYSKVAAIESRKEYALAVLEMYPRISGWLFRLRDGKFDELDVLRKLEV